MIKSLQVLCKSDARLPLDTFNQGGQFMKKNGILTFSRKGADIWQRHL
jgi:hypothetical protein